MRRLSRRQLIVLLIVIVAIVVLGVILFHPRNKKEETPVKTPTVTSSPQVSVTNPDTLENKVSAETLSSIQKPLYQRVAINSPGKSLDNVNVTIRQGSVTPLPDSEPGFTMMVDVPSLQESYRVEINDDAESDYHAVHIYCPDASQLVYPAFNCTEEQ